MVQPESNLSYFKVIFLTKPKSRKKCRDNKALLQSPTWHKIWLPYNSKTSKQCTPDWKWGDLSFPPSIFSLGCMQWANCFIFLIFPFLLAVPTHFLKWAVLDTLVSVSLLLLPQLAPENDSFLNFTSWASGSRPTSPGLLPPEAQASPISDSSWANQSLTTVARSPRPACPRRLRIGRNMFLLMKF